MMKVLIVEDERLIRKGIIYTIDWLSMDCVIAGEAKDGEEGLEKIKELKPDIVIADIKMPKKSGIEMLKAAKEELDISFESIILTSYSDFEYAREAIHLGVSEYLLKPIDDGKLEELIQKIGLRVEQRHKQEVYEKKANNNSLENLQIKTYKNPYVIDTINKIKENYNTKLTLEAVAEEMNISVTYLNKKLKEETAATFLELLNRYRVTKAGELLQTGKYRVYEISEMTGFSDYKHFCSVFKRYTGSSPTSFTKN